MEEANSLTTIITQIRMKKWSDENITDNELERLTAIEENSIAALIQGGYKKESLENICKLINMSNSQIQSYPFSDLIAEYEEFYFGGPYSTTYQGDSMYYLNILVVPTDNRSVLIQTGDIQVTDEENWVGGLIYSAVSLYLGVAYGVEMSIATFVIGELFNLLSRELNDPPSVAAQDYKIKVKSSTVPAYIFIAEGYSDPYSESAYSLGLVTCKVEFYERHISSFVIDGEIMRMCQPVERTVYDDYFINSTEYAMSVYRAGHGFEVRCPMENIYYLEDEYLGTFYHSQPYPDVWLYGLIGS